MNSLTLEEKGKRKNMNSTGLKLAQVSPRIGKRARARARVTILHRGPQGFE
jgi:hypothetical protein